MILSKASVSNRRGNAAEIRKQMSVTRQCGADGLVFFTWEALRPFADELAPDIKSYGQAK
jgi:hypothetical protein